jgi:hypothetical protein
MWAEDLYMIQDGHLYVASAVNGNYKVGSTFWFGPTHVTGIGSYLYIQQADIYKVTNLSTGAFTDSRRHRVDRDGGDDRARRASLRHKQR